MAPAARAVVGDGARNVYTRSVLTGVLNPKVAVFFLAFLPQFVHPERGMVWVQFLVLGVLLSLIGFGHSLVLSLAIGRYGRRLATGANRWTQRLIGTVFIALGLRLALQQPG
jgi:threonine/homoserine/homoserine lactone efflux protein